MAYTSPIITKIGEDDYEVKEFLLSLSSVEAVVRFENSKPRVISRTDYTDTRFDRHAIQACEFAILTGNYRNNHRHNQT